MHSTSPPFRIRIAAPGDLDQLLALEHAAFTTDHLSARQFRRHLHSPRAAVLVAVDADVLLGKAILFFRRDSDLARLYSIAVTERARGRGVAKALLEVAEKEARRRGCNRLRLEVRQDNAAAIALYGRRGYHRFGAREEYYEDGAAAWRYELNLAAARS